jgi:hypothetical protein
MHTAVDDITTTVPNQCVWMHLSDRPRRPCSRRALPVSGGWLCRGSRSGYDSCCGGGRRPRGLTQVRRVAGLAVNDGRVPRQVESGSFRSRARESLLLRSPRGSTATRDHRAFQHHPLTRQRSSRRSFGRTRERRRWPPRSSAGTRRLRLGVLDPRALFSAGPLKRGHAPLALRRASVFALLASGRARSQAAGRPAFPSHASVSSSRRSRSGARGRSTATAASRLPQ